MRLLRQILQVQGVHCALQADMDFRDFALCEGDDPHAGVGRFFEETSNMLQVPANPVQSRPSGECRLSISLPGGVGNSQAVWGTGNFDSGAVD
jgi:hypothetical protein